MSGQSLRTRTALLPCYSNVTLFRSQISYFRTILKKDNAIIVQDEMISCQFKKMIEQICSKLKKSLVKLILNPIGRNFPVSQLILDGFLYDF